MTLTRVLHVVNRMDRGGVESWLMDVLRRVERESVRMDVLVHSDQPGHYDEEIRRLGSRILRCSAPSQPLRYAARFLHLLRTAGPYDVIHSHVHHFSGFTLALARMAGVPMRIAHTHSDTVQLEAGAGPLRRTYLRAMELAVRIFATTGLAASEGAAVALFGPAWRSERRWRILHCGVDLDAFRSLDDANAVRGELGVPSSALLVAHVGRFSPPKNHSFLLQIARCVLQLAPDARFLLIGDGPLKAQVQAEASELGLAERVIFAGLRTDVARLLGASDVFLFPSVREGLPLAGLEAQAAALPIVLSDSITRELAVVPQLLHWRSLSQAPSEWANAVVAAARQPRLTRGDALAALELTDFSAPRSLRALMLEYRREVRLA